MNCTKCDISVLNDYIPLKGSGNKDAVIMFISKNPTSIEYKNEEALTSKNNFLFQSFLKIFNFDKSSIYITTAVKCKTPKNRIPSDIEIHNCRFHLENEINTINPKIIVLLGNIAIKSYFNLPIYIENYQIETLFGKCITHNNKVILFMPSPSNCTDYNSRLLLYYSFKTLSKLYSIINPNYISNV